MLVWLCCLATSSSTNRTGWLCGGTQGLRHHWRLHLWVLWPQGPSPRAIWRCPQLCGADGPCLKSQGVAQRQVKKRHLLLQEHEAERGKYIMMPITGFGCLHTAWCCFVLPRLSCQGLVLGGRPGWSLTHLPWMDVDLFAGTLMGLLSCNLPWLFADDLIPGFANPQPYRGQAFA